MSCLSKYSDMITAIFFESIYNHIVAYGKDILISPRFFSRNSPWADFILMGNLLNMYLPNGVMKVVSFLDSLFKFKCQCPDFTSTIVNNLASCS